jgi:hypothetical protein
VRRGKYHLLRNARVCTEDCPLCGTILFLVFGGDQDRMDPGWELYHVGEDPGEQHNLAGERPEVVAELAAAYHAWWDRMQPYLGDDAPRFAHSDPQPFPAMYWKKYRGPGPNYAPPPEGFLERLDKK